MSEFSFSNANPPTTLFTFFSIALLFIRFFSFIVSHPLYFFYLLFFSPYIFKLLSFLSPVFITTFLLVLALLLLAPSPPRLDSKLASLLHKCGSLLDKLRPVVPDGHAEDFLPTSSDEELELEAYKIVFEAVAFEVGSDENYVLPLEMESEEKHCLPPPPPVIEVIKTENVGAGELLTREEKIHECCGEKVKAVGNVEPEELLVGEVQEEERSMKDEGVSEAEGSKNISSVGKSKSSDEGDDHHNQSPRKDTRDESLNSNLGSFGSMRKEKEWRRTLACKLFEERHNVEGGEGMDSLWETYETDSSKAAAAAAAVAAAEGRKKKSKKKKKKGEESGGKEKEIKEEEEEEEEDEEEGMDQGGQLCCLQALKFSAGKMNLGMGRPNLVKISKAFKGIGWLHHLGKHGRKAQR